MFSLRPKIVIGVRVDITRVVKWSGEFDLTVYTLRAHPFGQPQALELSEQMRIRVEKLMTSKQSESCIEHLLVPRSNI